MNVDQLIVGVSFNIKDTLSETLALKYPEIDVSWKHEGVTFEVDNVPLKTVRNLSGSIKSIIETFDGNSVYTIIAMYNGTASIEGNPSVFGIKLDSKVVAVYE